MPLAANRSVCASTSASFCEPGSFVACLITAAASTAGKYNIAVLPAGVFPQSIINRSEATPGGMALADDRISNALDTRREAMLPGLAAGSKLRLRCPNIAEEPGVAPGGIGMGS